MLVKDIALRFLISADTVRYYTRIGLLNPVTNVNSGYKIYSENDCRRLAFILRARSLQFSIEEIRWMIQESNHGFAPCGRVRELMEEKIRLLAQEVKEKGVLLSSLQKALDSWQQLPDGDAKPGLVCALIEQWQADSQS